MRAVIFGNGEYPSSRVVHSFLRKGDLLIACDGGYTKAKKIGISPQVIIGDQDSLRSKKINSKVRVIPFPVKKDETDAELALGFAFAEDPTEILWFGALGNRPDHSLANLFLLESGAAKGIAIRIFHGRWEVFVVRKSCLISGKKGDRVSLVPLSEIVSGIQTRGLRYPLHRESLVRHKTRGLSNALLSSRARIELTNGSLLVFHEGIAIE